jgi:hypothetical protein
VNKQAWNIDKPAVVAQQCMVYTMPPGELLCWNVHAAAKPLGVQDSIAAGE